MNGEAEVLSPEFQGQAIPACAQLCRATTTAALGARPNHVGPGQTATATTAGPDDCIPGEDTGTSAADNHHSAVPTTSSAPHGTGAHRKPRVRASRKVWPIGGPDLAAASSAAQVSATQPTHKLGNPKPGYTAGIPSGTTANSQIVRALAHAAGTWTHIRRAFGGRDGTHPATTAPIYTASRPAYPATVGAYLQQDFPWCYGGARPRRYSYCPAGRDIITHSPNPERYRRYAAVACYYAAAASATSQSRPGHGRRRGEFDGPAEMALATQSSKIHTAQEPSLGA